MFGLDWPASGSSAAAAGLGRGREETLVGLSPREGRARRDGRGRTRVCLRVLSSRIVGLMRRNFFSSSDFLSSFVEGFFLENRARSGRNFSPRKVIAQLFGNRLLCYEISLVRRSSERKTKSRLLVHKFM